MACLRIATGKEVSREIRSFGTLTKSLLALADWLEENKVTQVAMEATGVYWKPIWHVLSACFTLILANPAHIKNVPGRKTDVKDAQWIADLLAHGLIEASFVPEEPILELRNLTRARKQLINERSRHVQRIQKTLQDANLKIDSFISDIMGKSGRAFLEAIIAGETDPDKLVVHADYRLKAKREDLVEALRGRITGHHRFMIRTHLGLVDSLGKALQDIEAEVAALLEPFRHQIELLTTMPGLSETSAHVILAEIGFDMGRFPTANHLISWAGLCPRCDESAGKRRSTRIRPGDPWLKETLVQCAWAAVRSRDSHFAAMFHRIKVRQGAKKAIVAVAAEMLRSAWHMLSRDEVYIAPVDPKDDPVRREREARRLVRKLQELGYNAEILQPASVAPRAVSE